MLNHKLDMNGSGEMRAVSGKKGRDYIYYRTFGAFAVSAILLSPKGRKPSLEVWKAERRDGS